MDTHECRRPWAQAGDEARPTVVQPIVLLGGFGSPSALYVEFRDRLSEIAGQPVWVVPTQVWDWIPSVVPYGWAHLLTRLQRSVQQALQRSVQQALQRSVQHALHRSTTGKVTLIGHSAGGVLARLYLAPEPSMGRAYRGLDHVDHLVTLGSPHYNQQRWLHGGMMSRWIERRYPGAFYGDQVRYTCVAGRLMRGDRRGSLHERNAYRFYDKIAGDGTAWGDGLIPVQAALLDGARQIVLEGVSHFTGFGGPWYGSKDVLPRWWREISI
jgi:pimeloyl-ACP methyl ester carboxylesterase